MPASSKLAFDDRIKQLIEYENENGHLFVPTGYTGFNNLGRWVNNTRTNKAKLKSGQITELERIGFIWKTPKGPIKKELIEWGNKLKLLVKFHKSKGHCNVPSEVGGKPYPLALWCDEQRQKFGEDNLDQNKIDRLNHLGFDFYGSSSSSKVADGHDSSGGTSNDEEQEDAEEYKRVSCYYAHRFFIYEGSGSGEMPAPVIVVMNTKVVVGGNAIG